MEKNVLPKLAGESKPGQIEVPAIKPAARPKSRLRAPLAATAAVMIMLLAVVLGIRQFQLNQIVTVITLDINPSMQLDANKNDRILRALPLNDAGAAILKDMNLERTSLDVAVKAIIGSMMQNGYLAQDINAFLVSVNNESAVKTAELRGQIASQLETLLDSNRLDGLIISQKMTLDEGVSSMARQYGISSGKAYLLRHIHEQYPVIPLDVLAAMTIGELADLFAHTLDQDEDVALHRRKPDDSDRLLIDRAAVLTELYDRWQLDPANIRYASVELRDGDRPVLVIEIRDGGKTYQAVVDARNGIVLRESWQQDPNGKPDDKPEGTPSPAATPQAAASPSPAAPSPKPTAVPTSEPTAAPTPAPSGEDRRLAAADARRMVVNRFGGIVQKIEYAYDDRNPMYKGEALKDGYKVVFEINARTASWVKWDVGNDNKWDDFSHALPDMITMDQAARSVIEKSGQANTFVQKIDFLWDDEKPLYQGEAFNKGVKYSFEIYAYGGRYQKWDISTGDETWAEKYNNVN